MSTSYIDKFVQRMYAANEKARLEAERAKADYVPPPPLEPIEPVLVFDTSSPWIVRSLVEAHKEATAWTRAVLNGGKPHWLTISGRSGCGKTHLMREAHRNISAHRSRAGLVQFWRWGKALDRMCSGDWDLMGQLCRLPVLFLDDVGAEGQNRLNASKLYELLEARLGKWTFISTNLEMGGLADIDPRIASRCYRGDSVVLKLGNAAADYCLERHKRKEGDPRHE